MCVEECEKGKPATHQQEGKGNVMLLSKAWESITPTRGAAPKRGSPPSCGPIWHWVWNQVQQL